MPAELEPDPIIVYGAPRSGTTYLEQILNAHPAVFISHETRVFAWLHHALTLTQEHQLVAGHRDTFVEHLRSVFPQVIRNFYRSLAPDIRYWGDKNPHYTDPFNRGSLELIDELFPGSRFIHIIRDGRDVVSSLTRKQWDEETPWATFDQAHRTWKQHVRLGRAFGSTLASGRYFELRYEDLIADDAALAGELFRFLGIEAHPAVEAFCKRQREQRTPFKGPTRDFGKGIGGSDWRNIFSPEEQARSLELIGTPLVRYGYETEESLAELRRRATAALGATDRRNPGTSATRARPKITHGYQKRDHEIIDYEMFLLPGTRQHLRGPAPKTLAVDEYLTCIGAAQTFGCLCSQPYPALLAKGLDLPVLNLGFAGAGSRFFLRDRSLLNYINQGRLAVVQVMSGRSEDNSLFDSRGSEQLTRRSDGARIGAATAYRELLENERPDTVRTIVEETRANWVRSYSRLLGAIQVPTILFWFSQRAPEYEEDYADLHGLFGEYPQLVNRAMVDRIRILSDEYVECISSRGFPQRLISRFTGEPAAIDMGGQRSEFDTYYPAPEMHADAADALMETARKYATLPR